MGTEKLKIGEIAKKTGITKRTIDYYKNIGLLEADRSTSNYRYYAPSMVDRLQYIEQRKLDGLSLEEIHAELQGSSHEEIDVQPIRLKMQNLEQEVATLVAHFDQQDKKSGVLIRK